MYSTFCHRMTYNFAQDPFLINVKEKNLSCAVTFLERKAGKMRKVTAQALLIIHSELVRMND
jgi:hypothetical protein